MVKFYRKRLIEYSNAVEKGLLAARLEGRDKAAPLQVLHARLTSLLSLIRNARNASLDCRYDEMVVLAHGISVSHRSVDEWHHFGSEITTHTLRLQLGFLGRLRRCFNTLACAAERLPYFSKISIIVCKSSRGSPTGLKPSRRKAPYDLALAFSSIGLTPHSESIDCAFEKENHKSLASGFEKLKTASWQVHAEV